MAKIMRCDAIFPGCSAEVRADTDEEVLRHVAEHARTVHGVQQVDEGTIKKVRAAIRSES